MLCRQRKRGAPIDCVVEKRVNHVKNQSAGYIHDGYLASPATHLPLQMFLLDLLRRSAIAAGVPGAINGWLRQVQAGPRRGLSTVASRARSANADACRAGSVDAGMRMSMASECSA
jgi:hypothetical protein